MNCKCIFVNCIESSDNRFFLNLQKVEQVYLKRTYFVCRDFLAVVRHGYGCLRFGPCKKGLRLPFVAASTVGEI